MKPVKWRPWSYAQPPTPQPGGGVAPVAPYALSFEGSDTAFLSTHRQAFAEDSGWDERRAEVFAAATPAGRRRWDGNRVEHVTTKSTWDAPNFATLESCYMTNANSKALKKHHRRYERNQTMTRDQREARWTRCFKQWSGGAPGSAAVTDFSLLPAGWAPEEALPTEPQVQRSAYQDAQHRFPAPKVEMLTALAKSRQSDLPDATFPAPGAPKRDGGGASGSRKLGTPLAVVPSSGPGAPRIPMLRARGGSAEGSSSRRFCAGSARGFDPAIHGQGAFWAERGTVKNNFGWDFSQNACSLSLGPRRNLRGEQALNIADGV
jgi:hypothetical protein